MDVVSSVAAAPVLSMPEPLQTIVFWVSMFGAVAILAYSALVARRFGTMVPVLLVIGAFCSVPLESLVGYLGHVTHPQVGSIAMYTAVDRTIPWHMAFGYTIAFGIVYLIIYQRAAAGTLNRPLIFKIAILTALSYFVVETVGVSTKLWVYFEPQAIWIWRMTEPPIWGILNATSEVLGASLVIFMLPHLKGIRQVLIIALCPIATVMGHFGAGFPWYNVINSSASQQMMDLSALLSAGLSVLVWWVAAVLATTPQTEQVR